MDVLSKHLPGSEEGFLRPQGQQPTLKGKFPILGNPAANRVLRRGGRTSTAQETLYIEPGSPWENGYIESFNGKSGDELLGREFFYTLLEVRVLTERYRRTCNQVRPHNSLGYRPPTPEAPVPADPVPLLVGRT